MVFKKYLQLTLKLKSHNTYLLKKKIKGYASLNILKRILW